MTKPKFIEGLAIVCLLSGITCYVEVVTGMWWLWIPLWIMSFALGKRIGRND